MTLEVTTLGESGITCASCQACCCRLAVLLIFDTGIPEHYTDTDQWGGKIMARLDDGWCAALDRETMRCTIYDNRPSVCREFNTGGDECLAERTDYSGG